MFGINRKICCNCKKLFIPDPRGILGTSVLYLYFESKYKNGTDVPVFSTNDNDK